MKGMIVEKIVIDMKTGTHENLYALAYSEPTPDTDKYSLLYEAYLTAWTPERPARSEEYHDRD